MLSRLFVLFAASICAFFLYKGTISATSNYEQQLPAPLPVPAERTLLGTEKEYLSVGSNPAFQKAAPQLPSKKRALSASTRKSLLRKITLKGIINAPGQQNDRVIIADKATGKESLLHIGDKIYGLTILRITKKAVTLQAQSEKIELTYAK